MVKITDSKRIEMLDNGRKSDKSDATIRMYGPALMGLPTNGGNLDLAPEIGDKFCAAGKLETTAEITAIAYRADRNYVELTCKRSDGKEFFQPFNRLYDALKAGQAVMV